MAVIRRLARLRHDRLVTNSLFITVSNASMGVLGFLFWVVATRLYRPDQVGVTTTLVSAGVLIAYLAQMGFNVSFVRFLPGSNRRSDDINTGLGIVFLSALVIGGAYYSVVPSFVPQLGFLRSHPWEAVAVVVFVAFGAVNLATDAVFIAFRSPSYNVVVDGLLQGSVRLVLPALLVAFGAFGLVTAYGLASVSAVLASIALMMWRFSYRPRPTISMSAVREVFRFGATNYVAELCTMVPVLALPLIVIHERGSAAAGYFYLSLAVAQMLFMGGQAVGQSLLAEGSNESAGIRELAVRAGRLQLVMLAAALVMIAGAHTLLLLFGRAYASHATLALVVLLASAPAVGMRNWSIALLRLRHRLAPVVLANLCLAVIPCVVAVLLVRRGLVWVSMGWLAGNVVAGAVATAALIPAGRFGRSHPHIEAAAVEGLAETAPGGLAATR